MCVGEGGCVTRCVGGRCCVCVCAYCSSLRPRGNGSGSLVGSCLQSVTSHTHNSDPGRSHSFEVLITRIVDYSLHPVDWG